ncbi:MAG: helix-turn-helix domain-containing protein [bacterium]
MENEKVFIATDAKTLEEVLNKVFASKSKIKELPEFSKDKLTQTQAAKLAGISIPTLKKEIRAGKFKEYSLGNKKYLLKSEVLEALRS